MQNRVIKFRAWDSISKTLHSWRVIRNNKFKDFDLEHYTIMQFTGLHDKNGKEIYESDVVLWSGKIRKVFYFKGSFYGVNLDHEGDGFPKSSGLINEDGLEVLGNIHENPELLK